MKLKLSAVAIAGLILSAVPAYAQDSTTGAVRGVVSDSAEGGPAIGATVVATSPALQGQRVEIAARRRFNDVLPPAPCSVQAENPSASPGCTSQPTISNASRWFSISGTGSDWLCPVHARLTLSGLSPKASARRNLKPVTSRYHWTARAAAGPMI